MSVTAPVEPASPPASGRGDFRTFLEGDGVAVFDGATGTALYTRGVFIHRAFEELNLQRPGLVRDVHSEYVAAGADIIETNTFAANRFRLSPHGLADEVEAINKAGVELAREAAGDAAWVAGAIGPLGVRIEPFGHIARDEAHEVFQQQAQALADAGVDLFVLETFVHLPELIVAVQAVRAVSDRPVVAQLRAAPGGLSIEGVELGVAAEQLEAAGADVIGVNCCEALAALDAIAELSAATSLPLSGQPNAGQPRSVAGRNIYLGSPEYLVAWGRRAVRSGARLVGGCCGTTPDHIRALRQSIGEAMPHDANASIARPRSKPPAAEPVPLGHKSRLAAALASGRFVTGVSLPPSRGFGVVQVTRDARKLALAGVTFVGLSEGLAARANVPPVALAACCQNAGIVPLVLYSARGRRLQRIQSDLLGAAVLGVEDMLLVTGDPLTPGAEQDAWPDLEIDSIGMVNLAVRLNHGEDVGGNPIGKPTALHVGVRLDPTAHDLQRELSRLHWKVDAGAEFAMTAPIFDPAALEALLEHVDQDRLPVIANVWPLRSAREAEFFEQRLASVPVPAGIVDRMRKAETDGTEEAEGLAIARELVAAVRPMVRGIQVAAPAYRVDLALSVLF